MQIRREVQGVIYNRFGDGTRVLLVKKLDMKRFNYRWRLLKGGVEGDETDEEALKREIMEEVGFRDIVIEKKINTYEFDYDGTLHQVSSFIVKAMSNEPMKIQIEEIVDAQWMPIDQALGLLFWPEEKKGIKMLSAAVVQNH